MQNKDRLKNLRVTFRCLQMRKKFLMNRKTGRYIPLCENNILHDTRYHKVKRKILESRQIHLQRIQ